MDGFNTGKAIGPILASTSCDYKLPANYPDKFLVGASIDLKNDVDKAKGKFTMQHCIWSLKHSRPAAIARADIACYDYRVGKSVSIPDPLYEVFETIQSKDSSFLYDIVLNDDPDDP